MHMYLQLNLPQITTAGLLALQSDISIDSIVQGCPTNRQLNFTLSSVPSPKHDSLPHCRRPANKFIELLNLSVQ